MKTNLLFGQNERGVKTAVIAVFTLRSAIDK